MFSRVHEVRLGLGPDNQIWILEPTSANTIVAKHLSNTLKISVRAVEVTAVAEVTSVA